MASVKLSGELIQEIHQIRPEAFGTVKGVFYLMTNKNKCVSFKFTKFIRSCEL